MLQIAASLLIVVAADASNNAPDETVIRNAVVKVNATIRFPDFDRPWRKTPAKSSTGSGVVIEGRRILTSAHVVMYADNVSVQAHDSDTSLFAKVAAIAPEVDLAILEIENDDFFNARSPLTIQPEFPSPQSSVSAYGYPVGGVGLSVTSGVVSRIAFGQQLAFGAFPIKRGNRPEPISRIQIDAAINPGNSGGPAIADGAIIGIAQATLSKTQGIGYLIAGEEIQRFLDDIQDGSYTGKPRLLDEWNPLVNPALRSKLKLNEETSGVVVVSPLKRDEPSLLRVWDVITRIGKHEIDNIGNAEVAPGLRLRFDYLVGKLAQDGAVPITVIRDGEELELDLPVARKPVALIPSLRGEYPAYFVYGPLVFTAASSEYVDVSGPVWWSIWGHVESPLIRRRYDEPDFEGEELVVVAMHLPHRTSHGYPPRYTQVVTHVNDVQIRNLRHFVQELRDSEERFTTFRFADKSSELLVFDQHQTLSVTEDILEANDIRRQGTDDVLTIWEAKTR